MPNCIEPPLPLAIAWIISGTSTPALSPSAMASAVAAIWITTRRLLTSLTRHAADSFEFGERAAAIADDAPAALDEVLRDRHADLTDTYKTDGLHFRLTP